MGCQVRNLILDDCIAEQWTTTSRREFIGIGCQSEDVKGMQKDLTYLAITDMIKFLKF